MKRRATKMMKMTLKSTTIKTTILMNLMKKMKRQAVTAKMTRMKKRETTQKTTILGDPVMMMVKLVKILFVLTMVLNSLMESAQKTHSQL